MSLFATAPFLGPVLGPVVGGFLSQYGTLVTPTVLIVSELEMDVLVVIDIRVYCHA